MKDIMVTILLALPLLVHAQHQPNQIDGPTPAVRLETSMSWQQVLAKAQATNKYIFVDCYAT